MKYLLLFTITLCLLFNQAHCWGIPDWAENAIDGTEEAATSTWNSLSTKMSEAASNAQDFFEEVASNPFVSDILSSITNVVTLTVDAIEDAVDDFNITTWKKMATEARYVIHGFPSQLQSYMATGCNYLSDLVDENIIPHPLDKVEDDDLYTLADCIGGPVYDLAVDWTKEVATTFTSIVGEHEDISSIDFSPLLNTEPIAADLNATYACLHAVGNDLQQRAAEAKDSVTDSLWEKALDYFKFENLTITVEISFTACTLTCGTASLGFAVNTADINEHRAFYAISMGVDSSNVVGAAIGARLGFRRKFNITGTHHGIKFGLGLKLPLLPSLPEIIVAISADDKDAGQFEGFILKSDIIDFSLGLSGAFGLGYSYTTTKWVYTTDDLKTAWNAVEDIVQDRKDAIDAVVDAYNTLTNDVLDHGGYFVKTAQNALTTLVCPSGVSEKNDENEFIGNLSVLQLGLLDIYHVVFGNVEGDNNCNSTSAYEAVRSQCQWGSHCQFTVDASTLGNLYCNTDDIGLTVIYGCPDQLDVFNLGCYAANFNDIVAKGWYQDYTDEILDDGWEKRHNGLAKCAKIAKDKGYPGFATYNNGMCLVAKDLFKEGVYNGDGSVNYTSECPLNGLGNDIALNLYAFASGDIAYDDLGCINSTEIGMYNTEHKKNIYTSFDDLEGEHYLFQDDYKDRRNSVSKCAQIAEESGYKGFALHDGGKCFLSNHFSSSVVDGIRELANISNTTTCSCSKGTKDAYSVFQFPSVEIGLEEEDGKGLSGLEIALIVVVPVVVIALCIIGFVLFKKCKETEKRGMGNREESNDYVAMHGKITGK